MVAALIKHAFSDTRQNGRVDPIAYLVRRVSFALFGIALSVDDFESRFNRWDDLNRYQNAINVDYVTPYVIQHPYCCRPCCQLPNSNSAKSLSGTYYKRRREVSPPMTPDAGLWTLDSPVPGSAEDIEGTTMDIDE